MTFGSFRLNTLSAAVAGPTYVAASGGTINYAINSGTFYKTHSFNSSGSFIVSTGGTVNALIVGGGGPGGGGTTYITGGGGGGGQVQQLTNITVTPQTYTITVGATQSTAATVGNSSSAFGTTSVGGGYGAASGSTPTGGAGGAAGGGGGGANTSSVGAGAGGTGTLAGGTGRVNTSNFRGGGGGGGSNGAAGSDAAGTANAATGTGGNGAAGTAITTYSIATEYYGGGGGGGGSNSAGTGGLGGGGGGGTAAGTAGTANTGGGGGGATASGIARAVPSGGSGIVKVQYAINSETFSTIVYVSTATSTTTSITIPTIQEGDLVFFWTTSSAVTTAPTAVTATGWTSVYSNALTSSTAMRQQCFYKIMDGTESGTTLTCLTGANFTNSRLMVYRPNAPITTVTLVTPVGVQSTIAAPTAQTLALNSYTGPYLGFAHFACNSGTGFASTTSTPSQTLLTTYTELKTFEASASDISFVSQTVSMSDGGSNAMSSFIVTLV